MLKRLIRTTALWMGRRRGAPSMRCTRGDPQLERYIAASLTDETLAWAVGTWRQRYL